MPPVDLLRQRPKRSSAAHFLPLYPPDARGDLAQARATDANPARNPAIFAHLGRGRRRPSRGPGAESPRHRGADRARLHGRECSSRERSASRRETARSGGRPLGRWGRARERALQRGRSRGRLRRRVRQSAQSTRARGARGAPRLWRALVSHRLASPARPSSRSSTGGLKTLADEDVERVGSRWPIVTAPMWRTRRRALKTLPIIATLTGASASVAFPRLAKPRYDTLHKWLKAHLPELRDLGEHFPSPERFDEIAVSRSLAFLRSGRRGTNAGRGRARTRTAFTFSGSRRPGTKRAPYPVRRVPRTDGGSSTTERSARSSRWTRNLSRTSSSGGDREPPPASARPESFPGVHSLRFAVALRLPGKIERRLATAILLTAVVPLAAALLLANSLFGQASAIWFNPEVGRQLDRGVDVFKDYETSDERRHGSSDGRHRCGRAAPRGGEEGQQRAQLKWSSHSVSALPRAGHAFGRSEPRRDAREAQSR